MAVQSGIYRGVPAEERVAERRTRLMEATLEVWADPARRTTMTAICAEAGLTERYFYESFSGLDEALRAVLDAIADEIEQLTAVAADEAGDDGVARTQATMRTFVEMIVSDPRKGRVSIVEAGAMPELRQRRTELLRHFAHRAAEEARQWFDLPERTAQEDELAGLLFIGGMAELITAWLDGAVRASADELVAAASHSFLTLYG
ncbi:MAG: TetR/AcrR family transcriptional regulator [Nocardioidaceae bacterium]|nr:TetR/AcrR family transcriptional regulator [Nocardioidaceae bacterium]MCL2612435.1 TetR/AcrR family transcriptional regulator [Nocardioidaceae bacterium]